MNNSELDNTIEQFKNIQLAMVVAKVNFGIVTELTEKYITRQLDEKQINSMKKALKEAVDFYTSINIFSSTANNTQNECVNIEANQNESNVIKNDNISDLIHQLRVLKVHLSIICYFAIF